MAKRIVLTTWGSFGDLHPFLALAIGLRERGHDPLIVSCACYRDKVQAEGIEFSSLQPDMTSFDHQAVMSRVIKSFNGTGYVVREMVAPYVRQMYRDIERASRGADLLISHPITFPTPLVARKMGLPWVGTALAPISFFSAYDPPILTRSRWISAVRGFSPKVNGALFGIGKRTTAGLSAPIRALSRDLGLPDAGDPLFEGGYSSHLNLALFSPAFAGEQPDWPERTVSTGFPFYDKNGAEGIGRKLSDFLDSGPKPLVFTLGSSAIWLAGHFYKASLQAAQTLGRRAVFLVGPNPENNLSRLPKEFLAIEYAPHSELFPYAEAVVHQGGVGTTAQGLRSGRPSLIVPYAYDQMDNAARCVRLGVGRTIPRAHYERHVTRELRALLSSPAYAERARALGRQIQSEDGVGAACTAVEKLLRTPVLV